MTGIYTPPATGMYTLHIENTRNLVSSTLLYNYIDSITIEPFVWSFGTDDLNVPCLTGKTVTLNLKGGLANGNKDYWIWMSVSGSYPGFTIGDKTVPLNWDVLMEYGLLNPGFPGSTAFIGKLDAFGLASAGLTLPADPHQLLVGMPIHLAYVLTAPGPALPVTFVSNPLHVKYCP